MNDQDKVDIKKSPYNYPTARKSIHNYRNTEIAEKRDMVKYGDISDTDEEIEGSSQNQDQGVDEVDNIQSKFKHPNPRLQQNRPVKFKKNRRKSLNNYDDEDESDSNMLAKSLPANLSSYYCSDEFLSQLQHSDFSKSHSISFEARTERNRSNIFNTSDTSPSKKYKDEHQGSTQTGKSCQHAIFTLTFAIIGLAAYCYKDFGSLAQGTNSIYDEHKFNKDINNLGDKYNINENSLLEVQSGISTILKRNDTGSFIFVYNGESEKFDYLRFRNFMRDIASTAARYLRNDTIYNQPTVLHSSELDMKNHSDLMNKYRHEVAKSGVLLVEDMDRVPSNLAMAFHYFCDEYNPLVAKSAIFFTLNFANCSDFPSHKSTHNNVEKCLSNIWKTIPRDNIKPLLARVVNVVIDVTNVL